MQARGSRRSSVLLALLTVVLWLAPGRLLAADPENADFSLRFPAALTRFASYGDVAGTGGASAASKWASSINPASVGWLDLSSPLHVAASPQYSLLWFGEGAMIHVAAEAVSWDSQGWGTFQPALAQIRSNKSTAADGTSFEMDIDYYQMQWGKRVGDSWAFGGAFNFSRSETRIGYGPLDVAQSDGEAYGFRGGALYRIVENLLAGMVVDYAFSPGRTTQHDFMNLGIGDIRQEDTTHQFLFRPGLSYEYQKDSCVYFDYQFGSFLNDTGHLNVNRFYGGVDHSIFKWLFIRGGAVMDTAGHPSWTAGLGIYPTDWFTIDIGYQRDMFPELDREFGRSQTLVFSLGFQF